MKSKPPLSTRKVHTAGNGAFVITLPREWVKELDIALGDHVLLKLEGDGSIKIIPSNLLN